MPDTWSQIPGLAQICNSGTYTWIVLMLLGYLIYRKRWKGLLVMAAPVLNVAIWYRISGKRTSAIYIPSYGVYSGSDLLGYQLWGKVDR